MANILIVEDDPTNAELAQLVCQQAGHSTRLVPHGVEALRRFLEKDRYDLVLLDILMPEMDGITLAMTLRESPAHAKLPIIAVTGVAGLRDKAKLLAAGMNDVVTKPYRPQELRRAIKRALGGASGSTGAGNRG